MKIRPTLLLGLPFLFSLSCATSQMAPRPPEPTEVVRSESRLQQAREIWEERRHRTPPGVSWREIERANRRRNLESRAARLAAEASAASPARWKERGSFDQTGRTRVTTVGSDGETLFVGTDRGGVFSGTPGGERWEPRSDGLGLGVQSFVIVPGEPEVWIAAGIGERNLGRTFQGPLYISADRGLTWSERFFGNELVLRMLRDPGRPRTVFVLTAEGAWDGVWKRTLRLYRSDDGGLHFGVVYTAAGQGKADLWIDRVDGGPLYLAASEGLLVSTDGGSTFTLAGLLPGLVEDVLLAGSEAGAPTLYAAVWRRADGFWRLVVSADGGRTWKERAELRDFWGTLTASITRPGLVFYGGIEAWRSIDTGRTFEKINNWYDYYDDPVNRLHADIQGIDCALDHGKEAIFFDTDGGTFRSEDDGRTVRNITQHGLGNGQYYEILTSRNDSERIAAGSQDQGYQVSRPGSGEVLRFDQLISGDYGSLTSRDGTHDMLYSSYPGFILLQLQEGSDQFEESDFPSPLLRRNHWIAPLAADPDNSAAVYYADRWIWRIERHRPNVFAFYQQAQDFGADDDYVSALAISPVDSTRWLAGTANGRLWQTRNRGFSWSRLPSAGLGYVTTVLPSPTDPDVWYAAGNGYAGPSVARTTDGGNTWEPWSRGLPATLVQALAFDDPARQDLYAATDAGPYRYDRPSGAWVGLLGTEAPLTSYTDVEGIPQDGIVRFATYGRGIWDYTPPPDGGCNADDQTFCFQNRRFEVTVDWKDFAGQQGTGHVVTGSGAESGLFWFFQPANWEMMVKVLDACSYNDRFWVFSAATTTVEYTLRVRDTQTGKTVEYKNPSGQASAAVTDTGSFPCSTTPGLPPAAEPPPPVILPERAPEAASAACETTATALCLSGRFRVEMDWRDSQNRTGPGQTAPLHSSDSGIFWFFSPANWETLTKIVNGCALNGHYWVFGAALTNVEYTLRVTDTVTGRNVQYKNPLGVSSRAIVDTSALPCH